MEEALRASFEEPVAKKRFTLVSFANTTFNWKNRLIYIEYIVHRNISSKSYHYKPKAMAYVIIFKISRFTS